MAGKKDKILKAAGYVCFFMFFFIFFLYLSFPYDALKDRMLQSFQGNSAFKLEMDSFSPSLITGAEGKGVRIVTVSNGKPLIVAKLDRAKMRIKILPLILGRVRISFNVDAYRGNLQGQWSKSGKISEMNVAFSNLDMGLYDFSQTLASVGDVKLLGILGGSVKGHFDSVDPNASTASVELDFKNLKMAPSTISGMPIPELAFQPAAVKMEMSKRGLNVTQGTLKGDQMEAELSGRMTVRDDFQNSNLNFNLKFKPSEELEKQFGPYLGMVNKKPDRTGYYRTNLVGTIASPRFR